MPDAAPRGPRPGSAPWVRTLINRAEDDELDRTPPRRHLAEAPGRPGATPACPGPGFRYTASTHAGTHADAPRHHDPGGAAIDEIPLDAYAGPARLLDLRGQQGPVVTPDRVAAARSGPPRLLLRTYRHLPHHVWSETFVTVLPETITLLAAHGTRLIGIDAAPVRSVPRTLS